MSNKFTGLDNINKPAFDAAKKLLKGKANVYTVDDFTDISQTIFSKLKVGDTIYLKDGNEQTFGIAIYTDGASWIICGYDGTAIYLYHYGIVDENWVYESIENIELDALISRNNKANNLVGFDNSGRLSVIQNGVKVWGIVDIFDPNEINKNMKVGDIIVDEDDNIVIINVIEFDNNNLTDLHAIGLSTITPAEFIFDGTDIVKYENENGTKLYLHEIMLSGAGAPSKFSIITSSNDQITKDAQLHTLKIKGKTLISAISDIASGIITPLLVRSSGAGTFDYYYLYNFDSTTGTFANYDLTSWTVTDGVTPL